MTKIAERHQGTLRRWMQSPSPAAPDPARVELACPDCPSWVFGADATEAADRLTEHRRERCRHV